MVKDLAIWHWPFFYWYMISELLFKIKKRNFEVHICNIMISIGLSDGLTTLGTRALIQYKDVILPVKEIPLWRSDGHEIILSPQWEYLYL